MCFAGSLFKFCTGVRLERLLLKFEENEAEKVDRVCELFFRYADKIDTLKQHFAAQDKARQAGVHPPHTLPQHPSAPHTLSNQFVGAR